ncbi:sodium:proton exchanger [Egibacter rhizosphaerae]|uniref:Sodium:proton exchanger n=1 Tax=Egibacter rhizosphaerae TaxID=1670831 RepID=A0A411YEP4_9ACTN|nr:cation:proton antiporter [Egibacter rhizosphaerae]QBI19695.1 sodium:proton exchanger [Egibacter rhizosphaerae]
MTFPLLLALIGGLAVALGLVSRPLRDVPLTEPLLALLLGALVGPGVLGWVSLEPAVGEEALRISAELAVAMAVMSVALRFSPGEMRSRLGALTVLLLVGMAAMALLSSVAAGAILGLATPAAVLLGVIVTPTDPVLAANVVEGEPAERQLPQRVRLLLSVESGANDGLAAPMVMLAGAGSGALVAGVGQAAASLVVSAAVGVAAGWIAGRGLLWSERHRDLEESAFLALTLALTLAVLGAATLAGGVGVLAVFVAGLVYSAQVDRSDRREEWQVQEAINRYMVLPVFVLLGVTAPWEAWAELGWAGLGFVAAVLALRRLPVLLALTRVLGVRVSEAAFMGWFGPVGAAALLYLAEQRDLGQVDDTVWAAGTLLVAISTVVFGLTAAPGRRLLARR